MYRNHTPCEAEYRWRGCNGYPSYSRWSSEQKFDRDDWELLASSTDAVGYAAKLWRKGKMLAISVTYWRGDRDASKEGYTEDVSTRANSLDLLWERAERKGVTQECIDDLTAELEADEHELVAS